MPNINTRAKAILLGTAILAYASGARADYTCQADSNVCSYSVETGSTSPVDLGGGGHTADKREWIVAPGDKYFVNPSAAPQGFTGRNVHCEMGGSDGVQQRAVPVGDTTVTVTFAKKYLVIAHAETGSGPTNISHTAMMICGFNAQLAPLPN
jgi:hypothetical protein